jgi:dihydrofolate reductase
MSLRPCPKLVHLTRRLPQEEQSRPVDRRARFLFSPAVSLTTLTSTFLAVVKPLGPYPGAAGVQQSKGDEFAVVASLYPNTRSTAREESIMTATYTFDVFSSLDGFGAASGNWTGYWGKQGPELLDHRLALYSEEQRMVFGANTYRAFARMLASSTEESEVRDPWVQRMRSLPATVVSTTLEGPLDWPDATVVSGDAIDVVARLKEESEIPLRSHGSLSMNRALMAAGLVDRLQVTLFPVITGQTGLDPIFQGAADFDLELIESRTLDGHIQELIYRPALHV